MMNGNAEKKCDGIFVSHPSVSGKVYASAAFWTLNVLKNPKMSVPRIALAGLQLAKITSVTVYPAIGTFKRTAHVKSHVKSADSHNT